jgi:hypothetical protein
MKNDEMRLKIIKDTVTNSIISDLNIKLASKIADEKKRTEMVRFARLGLKEILNSSNQDLLPKRELISKQDFEKYILKVIRQVRKKLVDELEKEFPKESLSSPKNTIFLVIFFVVTYIFLLHFEFIRASFQGNML